MRDASTEHVFSPDARSTLLFVPASEPKKVGKIPDLDADGYILDLEDTVVETRKGEARRTAETQIERLGSERRVWVRVNPVGNKHHLADVEAVTLPGLAGLLLPKTTSAEELRDLDDRMAALEHDRGIKEPIPVSPILETCAGIHNVGEVAESVRRVAFLTLGAGDLSLDAGIDWPHDDVAHPLITHARVALVIASRAAGLPGPHDGVYPRHRDTEGLRSHSIFARKLGFSTKHVIHPAQVDTVREIFRPTAQELDRAKAIVAAFETAERQGLAAISVDDSLVDYPVYQRALNVLNVNAAE